MYVAMSPAPHAHVAGHRETAGRPLRSAKLQEFAINAGREAGVTEY